MRSLEEMKYADAKATIREAEEIKECRPLTFEEAAILATALQTVREMEGTGEEKAERRARWERRKRQSRDDFFGKGHRS